MIKANKVINRISMCFQNFARRGEFMNKIPEFALANEDFYL